MIPSKLFTGFYEIPDFSRYVISMYGDLLNKENNELIFGSKNPAGYLNFRLIRDSDGHTLTIGRHRLMCIAFKSPPAGYDVSELVANHDNGVKGDDRLDNLSWTTPKGNCEHAGETGLSPKCTPIFIRNVSNNTITKFPSMIECAKALNLTKDTISHRCNNSKGRIWPCGHQYSRVNDDDAWKVTGNSFGVKLNVSILDHKTGIVREFNSLGSAANYFGLLTASLSQWLSEPDQPVITQLLQVKLKEDKFRVVKDALLEYEQYAKKRVTCRIGPDNDIVYYLSSVICSKYAKITPIAMYYRLKIKGLKQFKDGYRYCYYTDLSSLNLSNCGESLLKVNIPTHHRKIVVG